MNVHEKNKVHTNGKQGGIAASETHHIHIAQASQLVFPAHALRASWKHAWHGHLHKEINIWGGEF